MSRHIVSRKSRWALTASACASLVGAPLGVHAQEGEAVLDEITITAQRREETLQKSSLAIEVLSEDALTRAGITQAVDITAAIPGVQIGSGGAQPQVYIRGVGDYGATSISNPAIAFNVDGVYVARGQAVAGSFFDLARMEVLKGPQGTLYGRNASGGAINLIPQAPKLGELEGYAEVGLQNYQGRSIDAAVNLPLGEQLAARVAGQSVRRDGYMSEGTGDDVHDSVRAQLLFKPSEMFDARLWGSYSHIGGRGAAFALYDPNGNPAIGRPATANLDPWTSIASSQTNTIIAGANTALNAQRGSPPPGTSWLDSFDPSAAYQDMKFQNFHVEANWHLDWATLTIIPAYQFARIAYRTYPGLSYASTDLYGAPEESNARSLESRLANNSDTLKWVVGAYYFNEDQDSHSTISNGFMQRLSIIGSQETTSYAAFGQATYSVTEPLRVILGGRYTHEKKDARFDRYNFSPNQDCYAGPVSLVCYNDTVPNAGNNKVTDSAFNYRAGIEYDLAEEHMLFATLATGFKAGGLSQAAVKPFKPEKLTALTLGSRNRFLDNSLQLNLEAFYYDYKDHQEFVVATDDTGKTGSFVLNAGNAKSYGANVDVVWAPAPSDQLRVAAEYVHATYDTFKYEQPVMTVPAGSTGCTGRDTGRLVNIGAPVLSPVYEYDCSGQQMIRTPKWSGLASYAHSFVLGGAGSIDAGIDMSYASSRWLSTAFIDNVRAPGYASWNASITYNTSGERIQVAGFIRNITDETVYTGANQSTFVGGLVAANIAAPRTYGVRLRVKF
jgi:iron complex outermembrane receptor protein